MSNPFVDDKRKNLGLGNFFLLLFKINLLNQIIKFLNFLN